MEHMIFPRTSSKDVEREEVVGFVLKVDCHGSDGT